MSDAKIIMFDNRLKKVCRILGNNQSGRMFPVFVYMSVIKNITTATTPFDFKGKLLRWCYMIAKED